MRLLITGGAGFIGINFVKHFQSKCKDDFLILDKMSYSSNQKELDNMGVPYAVIDLIDRDNVDALFKTHRFTHVVHFAAESHVDNSIRNTMPFIDSNITGTVNLLDACVKYGIDKFVHISTDEVFGVVPSPGQFNEYSNIAPRNPYSASKAAAEHFVIAYGNTHQLPYVIVNSSNNYGPFQHTEKLIPLVISNVLAGKKVPVYGKGDQVRDWIYVEDTCNAIYQILTNDVKENRYCIGGKGEICNLDLVKKILYHMDTDDGVIKYVEDRPGHDFRYSIDFNRIRLELNWQPVVSLDDGLKKTIDWYTKG